MLYVYVLCTCVRKQRGEGNPSLNYTFFVNKKKPERDASTSSMTMMMMIINENFIDFSPALSLGVFPFTATLW